MTGNFDEEKVDKFDESVKFVNLLRLYSTSAEVCRTPGP